MDADSVLWKIFRELKSWKLETKKWKKKSNTCGHYIFYDWWSNERIMLVDTTFLRFVRIEELLNFLGQKSKFCVRLLFILKKKS